MDIFKASAEKIAAYLSFLVAFTTSPRRTILALLFRADAPAGAKPLHEGLDADLLWYCAFGVGAAFVVAGLGDALGMARDNSQVLAVLARIGPKTLPLTVVLAVFGGAVVVHVAAKVSWLIFQRHYEWTPLRTVYSSINAGFAVSAWYVLLLTLVAIIGMVWLFAFLVVQVVHLLPV